MSYRRCELVSSCSSKSKLFILPGKVVFSFSTSPSTTLRQLLSTASFLTCLRLFYVNKLGFLYRSKGSAFRLHRRPPTSSQIHKQSKSDKLIKCHQHQHRLKNHKTRKRAQLEFEYFSAIFFSRAFFCLCMWVIRRRRASESGSDSPSSPLTLNRSFNF